jgi:glycosyltransferase involved in cell wall biosynthesis
MSITILYLITELDVGGAQVALLRMLKGLDRTRFSPAVACLYNGDRSIAREIRALSIPVFDARMRSRRDVPALWRLYNEIRRVRPTILHAHLFHANLPGRILGRLAGVPIIICTEHSMALESELRYRLNRWTIGLVDRVIAVSANVRDFCISHIGLPPEKVTLIYNGIELSAGLYTSRQAARARLGLSSEETVLGVVSRLDPAKGIDVLIRAMPFVENATLVIVGDGVERSFLEGLAEELGVSGRIIWAGYRPDVYNLLQAFDVFVQPSRFEGLPTTVLEAMAAGLPVVATAVGGTPEVVEDGVTGLLVPPAEPTALAQAINHLLGDPALRLTLGRAGRERAAKQFSVEKMVCQTEALYMELCREKSVV